MSVLIYPRKNLPISLKGLILKPNQFHTISSRKALSLMEILVSLMVLSLVFLGLLNLFISGRKYIQHSQSRITAIELGKLFMDPLQMEVRQNDWDGSGNYLTVGRIIPFDPQTKASVTYSATSDPVTAVGTTTLRRVKTTITWNEKQ